MWRPPGGDGGAASSVRSSARRRDQAIHGPGADETSAREHAGSPSRARTSSPRGPGRSDAVGRSVGRDRKTRRQLASSRLALHGSQRCAPARARQETGEERGDRAPASPEQTSTSGLIPQGPRGASGRSLVPRRQRGLDHRRIARLAAAHDEPFLREGRRRSHHPPYATPAPPRRAEGADHPARRDARPNAPGRARPPGEHQCTRAPDPRPIRRPSGGLPHRAERP
jgi:hypothetical protein